MTRPGSPRPLRRSAFARVVIGVWLAVHAVVAAAVPVIDAMAGPERSVVAHWEDAQDTSCPPQHDPATCQLCRQVSTNVTDELPERASAVCVVRAATIRPRDNGPAASATTLRGAPDPRGPPTV